MFFHPSYFLLIPGMILVWWAQQRVQSTYRKYSQIQSSLGLTGAEVAETILKRMGVQNVTVEPIAGELTDHYDPTAKAVRLSEVVYGSSSLAAAAVAAHECGHVLQDVKGYKPMNIRAALVPAVNLGSNLGPLLIFAGLFLGALGGIFIKIGIVLFASVIIFHLVTLPVEFDASSRALRIIDELGILQGEENQGARKVLNAAAFTYVATALYAVLQLAQYLIIAMSRRN
ncbi:flagellar biosynthesis protein FlgM [Phormidesmis priestleyi ULC007]|uniref:Flagellar biosynthesis protein FlgM n=1 Tax=Phormidesmis priestleyi ULC007 TaxID=1920490 RepID=A0A2T1DLT8_9CYAN|nr:zinc metallopeptidase [Phormidesmis priestleyi]PSB21468.1 flagellar biosynthesis protein FlgM [Phormidesmis priestleyi ULC007]PZO46698.1 MAG: flagellar biosynthesis protein FlgM [Phormidesmis priestleyi]